MAEIVVADAGPLIALGRLRKLELLADVFEKVIVSPAVLDETQYRADLADAQAIFAARQSGLLVVDGSPGDPEILPSDANLGVGEAAAICLRAAQFVPPPKGDIAQLAGLARFVSPLGRRIAGALVALVVA